MYGEGKNDRTPKMKMMPLLEGEVLNTPKQHISTMNSQLEDF
jgi:hypothetical protein